MQEREGKGERERGKRLFTNTGSKNSSWPVNSRTITAVLNVLVAPALIAAAPVSLLSETQRRKGKGKGWGEREGKGKEEEEKEGNLKKEVKGEGKGKNTNQQEHNHQE